MPPRLTGRRWSARGPCKREAGHVASGRPRARRAGCSTPGARAGLAPTTTRRPGPAAKVGARQAVERIRTLSRDRRRGKRAILVGFGGIAQRARCSCAGREVQPRTLPARDGPASPRSSASPTPWRIARYPLADGLLGQHSVARVCRTLLTKSLSRRRQLLSTAAGPLPTTAPGEAPRLTRWSLAPPLGDTPMKAEPAGTVGWISSHHSGRPARSAWRARRWPLRHRGGRAPAPPLRGVVRRHRSRDHRPSQGEPES
jgi:hypothetical protein